MYAQAHRSLLSMLFFDGFFVHFRTASEDVDRMREERREVCVLMKSHAGDVS